MTKKQLVLKRKDLATRVAVGELFALFELVTSSDALVARQLAKVLADRIADLLAGRRRPRQYSVKQLADIVDQANKALKT